MIAALISFLIGLILTFNEKVHLLKKPFTGSKIAVILLLLFSAVFSFWKEREDGKDRQKDSDTIKTLSIRDSILSDQVDSLRKENKVAQKKYEDSLVKYGKEHTSEIRLTALTMAGNFAAGTRAILDQADKDAKKLRDTIRVLKERRLPHVTYGATLNNPLRCIQSNDTFFVLPSVANRGGSVAKNVNWNIYFLFSDGKKDYEYWRSLSSAVGVEIAPDETKYVNRSANNGIAKYSFDSTNTAQFILILGSYTNDDQENLVKKDIKLCYKWNPDAKLWGEFGDVSLIEKIHHGPNLNYFGKP